MDSNPDEPTIKELEKQVWLVNMDDDELVSRLCLAYEDNTPNEAQVNTFREYHQELMRRLAQRNETSFEVNERPNQNAPDTPKGNAREDKKGEPNV